MKRKTYILITLLWLVFIAALAQDDSEKVIVRFQVKSNYELLDSSINHVNTLTYVLPPTVTKKAKARSMIDFIQKTYNVKCAESSSFCGLLDKEIRLLNKVQSFSDLIPEHILVPTLPVLNKSGNAKKNDVVFMQYSKRLGHDGTIQEPLTKTFPTFDSEKAFVDVEMTMAQLDTMRSQNFVRLSVPLAITFEIARDSSDGNADWSYMGYSASSIENIIQSEKVQRVPYIFILDSGFPNKKRYDESVAEFSRIMDKAWAGIGAESPSRNFPAFREPSCSHCKQIESSLNPLASMNSLQKNFKLIYIPLSKEQGGDQFLFELMRYYEVKTTIGDSDLTQRQIKRIVHEADGRARDLLKDLPNEIGKNCDRDKVQTNYNVMYSLQYVADFIAENEKTYFFVNLSWSPSRNTAYLTSTLKHRGLFLVAAGNSSDDILLTEAPFGNYIVDRADVFAAINVNGTSDYKANCNTGWISNPQEKDLYAGMALGFPGDLSPVDCGGTSFSAPRLALFFALGESIRKKYYSESLSPTIGRDVKQTIQLSATNPFEAIWFDPRKYLTIIKNQ